MITKFFNNCDYQYLFSIVNMVIGFTGIKVMILAGKVTGNKVTIFLLKH